MQTWSMSGVFKPKVVLSLATKECPTNFEHTSYTQASKDARWKEAMTEEFNALVQNGTWQLGPYRPNLNLLSCKWVYRNKYHADGTIEQRKA